MAAEPRSDHNPDIGPSPLTPIWDPALRLFHWLLAASVMLGIYSGWQGKLEYATLLGWQLGELDWGKVHVYAAHSILVLVIWRLLWGLVGSDTAKLSRLIPTVSQLRWSLTKAQGVRAAGHDALGSLGTIFLLTLVAFQATSGQYIEDDDFFAGPLNGAISGDLTNLFKRFHALIGDILPWLIGAHVAVMIFYRLVKKVNLVKPMLTGSAPAAELREDPRSTHMAPLWRAAACLGLALAIVYSWTQFKGPTSLF